MSDLDKIFKSFLEDYPQFDSEMNQIKTAISKLLEKQDIESRVDEVTELKKWCGLAGDYRSEQMCIDRLNSLSQSPVGTE